MSIKKRVRKNVKKEFKELCFFSAFLLAKFKYWKTIWNKMSNVSNKIQKSYLIKIRFLIIRGDFKFRKVLGAQKLRQDDIIAITFMGSYPIKNKLNYPNFKWNNYACSIMSNCTHHGLQVYSPWASYIAPDFWCSGVLDTIKKFLPEDKFEVGFSRA